MNVDDAGGTQAVSVSEDGVEANEPIREMLQNQCLLADCNFCFQACPAHAGVHAGIEASTKGA